ncbi:hypothetical protein CPB85DRAFT_394123 [Mucidula mucida]|nr:hypothetical protein CPB85DRAFT_394123 [Mucidula mucida]
MVVAKIPQYPNSMLSARVRMCFLMCLRLQIFSSCSLHPVGVVCQQSDSDLIADVLQFPGEIVQVRNEVANRRAQKRHHIIVRRPVALLLTCGGAIDLNHHIVVFLNLLLGEHAVRCPDMRDAEVSDTFSFLISFHECLGREHTGCSARIV